MKSLSDYTNEPLSALWDRTGAFFVFNTKQFEEKAQAGVEYARIPNLGLLCPKDQVVEILQEMDRIHTEGVEALKRDHTPEEIILDELRNHEAFYTWSIEDTLDVVKGYGFTREQVQQVFDKYKNQ